MVHGGGHHERRFKTERLNRRLWCKIAGSVEVVTEGEQKKKRCDRWHTSVTPQHHMLVNLNQSDPDCKQNKHVFKPSSNERPTSHTETVTLDDSNDEVCHFLYNHWLLCSHKPDLYFLIYPHAFKTCHKNILFTSGMLICS